MLFTFQEAVLSYELIKNRIFIDDLRKREGNVKWGMEANFSTFFVINLY